MGFFNDALREFRNVDECQYYTDIILDISQIAETGHNKYSMGGIEELASGILLTGLQQPLIVALVGEEYRLVSGHRRIGALAHLIREGHEKFRAIPCRYRKMGETEFKITLLCGNLFNRKMTSHDLMIQAAEWKEALTKAKEEKLLVLENGERIRDYVAEILGISATKVAQLEIINKNAPEDVKENLKGGKIGITAAYNSAKKKNNDKANEEKGKKGQAGGGLPYVPEMDIPPEDSIICNNQKLLSERLPIIARLTEIYEFLSRGDIALLEEIILKSCRRRDKLLENKEESEDKT
ncbi:MAG: ParB N-terminal domain-containing protein [Lachnospiraceae bacterium]|nr:ParB N-terminal domain-containing protein [Lachnospiraceae bacterium]